MIWIFIGGMLMTNFAARQGWINEVDYSRLFPIPSRYSDQVRGKRVMIVGRDEGLYMENSLGGFFLDWELSHGYFEGPGTYENIIKMNDAFVEDPPEVIVDELNLMEPILERLPRVKMHYKKEGSVYRRL